MRSSRKFQGTGRARWIIISTAIRSDEEGFRRHVLVFADTFYWIALTNKLDTWHEQALTVSGSLSSSQIVTTENVITEYLNFFAEWGEHFRRKVSVNVRGALALPSVEVLPHTHESFLAGLALYEARLDKGYSLTDCTSMEIMRNLGMNEVLTNDRHFEQEGFHVLFRA